METVAKAVFFFMKHFLWATLCIIYMYVHVCLCISVYMCVSVYICMCLCVRLSMSLCASKSEGDGWRSKILTFHYVFKKSPHAHYLSPNIFFFDLPEVNKSVYTFCGVNYKNRMGIIKPVDEDLKNMLKEMEIVRQISITVHL